MSAAAGARVRVRVDGVEVDVPEGASAAVAVALAGRPAFRTSVLGTPRAPLCGMGICFECRVRIGGRDHVRSCMQPCEPGMEIVTRAG